MLVYSLNKGIDSSSTLKIYALMRTLLKGQKKYGICFCVWIRLEYNVILPEHWVQYFVSDLFNWYSTKLSLIICSCGSWIYIWDSEFFSQVCIDIVFDYNLF